MALNAEPTETDPELSRYSPEVQKVVHEWTGCQVIDLHANKRKLIGREYGVRKRVRKGDITFIPDRESYEASPAALEFGKNPYVALPSDAYIGEYVEKETPVKLERAPAPMIPRHDDDAERTGMITSHPSYLIPLPKEPKEPKKRKSKAKNVTGKTAVKTESRGKGKAKVKLEEGEESTPDTKAENDTAGPATKRRKSGKSGTAKKEDSEERNVLDELPAAEPAVSIAHLIADSKKLSLLSLPAEVRVKVYRNVLIAKAPIRVHGNWTLVYPLQHLNLSSKLLQTNSLVFKEASAVLYGDNVFKYVLRDVSNSIQYDSEMATDDNPLLPGEEDEDELYVDGHQSSSNTRSSSAAEPKIRRRLAPRKSRKLREMDINLNRYIGHFREIIVEAERNRWDEYTQKAMGDALKVFTTSEHRQRLHSCDEMSYNPIRPRLRSMTIRVNPSAAGFDGTTTSQSFTMVNFFDANSEVMSQVKSLPCRWLYIHLIAPEKPKSNRSKSKSSVKTKGYSLSLDTDRLFDTAGESDPWKHDPVIKKQRDERLANCEAWLRNLRGKVQYHCGEGKFATERDYDSDDMPDGMEGWYDNEY